MERSFKAIRDTYLYGLYHEGEVLSSICSDLVAYLASSPDWVECDEQGNPLVQTDEVTRITHERDLAIKEIARLGAELGCAQAEIARLKIEIEEARKLFHGVCYPPYFISEYDADEWLKRNKEV